MAEQPLILALANPTPEILPELAKQVRPDAIIATGRSDYPNQVNNVLCFPFIFRGALDVGATTINEEMKLACVDALARLARVPPPETVTAAYGVDELRFGPDYLIPKPFDPRLIVELPPAVAKAAMDTGVAIAPARRPRPLPPAAVAARDPLRPDDEADLRGRRRQSAAAGLHRRRGGARAARRAGRGRGAPGAPDPDRPARGDRSAGRAPRARPAGRPRLRAVQPEQRPALQRLCRLLSRAHRRARASRRQPRARRCAPDAR